MKFIQQYAVYDSSVDYVFLYIRMPDMDGFDLLYELDKLSQHPFLHSKVYILSSTLDERDLEKSKSIECVTDFMGKPLTIELCSKLFST